MALRSTDTKMIALIDKKLPLSKETLSIIDNHCVNACGQHKLSFLDAIQLFAPVEKVQIFELVTPQLTLGTIKTLTFENEKKSHLEKQKRL